MRNLVARFVKDESGATAIEYGLIAAGIGVAIVTVVGNVGDDLVAMFEDVEDGLNTE
jgi:pilus assembly protein Flp/PilA